jgi:hypothetical protein
MHPTLTAMAAQQHVEDVRRAANRYRVARAVTANGRGSRDAVARQRATARRYWPEPLRRPSIRSLSRR